MMTEENVKPEGVEPADDGLSAEDRAYFESEGEAPLASDKPENPDGEKEGLQAETETVDQPRNEKGQFVPHSVFHAKNEEYKKLRSEADELREFKARMEERFRIAQEMQQNQQQTQEPEDPEPDPNQDIFAHHAWLARQNKGILDRLAAADKANQEAQQRTQQIEQAKQQEAQVWNYWEQSARAYNAENADFGEAAKWLSSFRDDQLQKLAGIHQQFADPNARNWQIEQELKAIVIQAAQQRKNPAEEVYKIAQGYGYQPQKAPTQLPEQLQRVQNAQQANRSVSQASGNSSGNALSMEDIVGMQPKEFEIWHADPKNAAYFDKLMGG